MATTVRAGNEPMASMFNIATARYASTDTTTQIFGNTTVTLAWASALNTTSLVTASGTNNTTFTLNKAGIWIVEFSTRIVALTGTTIGDVYGFARLLSSKVEFCGQTIQQPLVNNPKPQAMTIRAFDAGDQIEICFNNQVDATIQLQCASEREHVSFTWLQGI